MERALARPRTLPALAVATLAGIGLGVHLGRAAIGAVDPFYFTDPAGTESYAELVPAASLSRPWSNDLEPDGGDYGWPASCVGCGSDRAVYEPAPYDGFQDAWTPSSEAEPRYAVVETVPALDDEIESVAADIEREFRSVERYAYYPVRHEAARAQDGAVAAVLEEERSAVPTIEPRRPLESILPQEPVKISAY